MNEKMAWLRRIPFDPRFNTISLSLNLSFPFLKFYLPLQILSKCTNRLGSISTSRFSKQACTLRQRSSWLISLLDRKPGLYTWGVNISVLAFSVCVFIASCWLAFHILHCYSCCTRHLSGQWFLGSDHIMGNINLTDVSKNTGLGLVLPLL